MPGVAKDVASVLQPVPREHSPGIVRATLSIGLRYAAFVVPVPRPVLKKHVAWWGDGSPWRGLCWKLRGMCRSSGGRVGA